MIDLWKFQFVKLVPIEGSFLSFGRYNSFQLDNFHYNSEYSNFSYNLKKHWMNEYLDFQLYIQVFW